MPPITITTAADWGHREVHQAGRIQVRVEGEREGRTKAQVEAEVEEKGRREVRAAQEDRVEVAAARPAPQNSR